MSLEKGLFLRGPEVIGFMGLEELFWRPTVFLVGIKVTSFLPSGFKTEISSFVFVLFFLAAKIHFSREKMDFCYRGRAH